MNSNSTLHNSGTKSIDSNRRLLTIGSVTELGDVSQCSWERHSLTFYLFITIIWMTSLFDLKTLNSALRNRAGRSLLLPTPNPLWIPKTMNPDPLRILFAIKFQNPTLRRIRIKFTSSHAVDVEY